MNTARARLVLLVVQIFQMSMSIYLGQGLQWPQKHSFATHFRQKHPEPKTKNCSLLSTKTSRAQNEKLKSATPELIASTSNKTSNEKATPFWNSHTKEGRRGCGHTQTGCADMGLNSWIRSTKSKSQNPGSQSRRGL